MKLKNRKEIEQASVNTLDMILAAIEAFAQRLHTTEQIVNERLDKLEGNTTPDVIKPGERPLELPVISFEHVDEATALLRAVEDEGTMLDGPFNIMARNLCGVDDAIKALIDEAQEKKHLNHALPKALDKFYSWATAHGYPDKYAQRS